jgi:nitronate monooxygenase
VVAVGAAERGSSDFLAMWAGHAAPLARELPADDLIAQIISKATQVLAALTACSAARASGLSTAASPSS